MQQIFAQIKMEFYHNIFDVVKICKFFPESWKMVDCFFKVVLSFHKLIDVGGIGFYEARLVSQPILYNIVSPFQHWRGKSSEIL